MTNLLRAGAGMLALAFSVPAAAQYANCAAKDADGRCVPGAAIVVAPAASVPLTGNVTGSAATPTSGSCTFAGGVATCGPFVPTLGLPVRLLLKGSVTSAWLGTTTAADCSAPNQLTAGGAPVSYTGPVDETVDMPPTTGGVRYCLVAQGNLSFAVRQ